MIERSPNLCRTRRPNLQLSLGHCPEERARQQHAKERARERIGPAQQKRLAYAQKNKILDAFKRKLRNGEDLMARSVSSELAKRFNVSQSHVRELRKNWLRTLKPDKRN
ncbi:hypothetical protein LA345_21590 [Burkholderia vietnamiensis]|uniref:Uncharacterized protein n=1 Tax=Burkholderia vietnamiensis (strain G4 / LMG 22486) TaxID=269482 RepID=A4JAZ3_BURVG|nr:hypothetical protein Bcep1808_0434 [Burkholderia vietnamiensis G4]MCB4346485.1 hypothetical protein [Burkholderia vietnamiensis]